MPHEDRRIIFEFDEAYKAIYSLCVQREKKKPPPGMITAIEQNMGDEQKLSVCIENQQEKTEVALEYTQDFLAAALMLYCRGLGIPLPKNATKSVMFGDENVTLRVQI